MHPLHTGAIHGNMTVGARIRTVCARHCCSPGCGGGGSYTDPDPHPCRPGGDPNKPLIPSTLSPNFIGNYYINGHGHCHNGACMRVYEVVVQPGFNQVCCKGQWGGAFMRQL